MTSMNSGLAERQAAMLRGLAQVRPEVAVVLGSGLGEFAGQLTDPVRVAVSDIPDYPRSTVAGHVGALHFGRITEAQHSSPPLVIFQGRVHYYESADLATAVAPVRLAHALGARAILLTNAAGGIDRTFRPGDLMLIEDVITLNPSSASVVSPSLERHRDLFDRELQAALLGAAQETRVQLRRGTYAWVHGPSYETASEVRMLGILGASAVGMSTVPEFAEAQRLGLRAAGISLISNMGTGISDTRLTHEEVTATAREASERFTALLRYALLRFPR